MLHSLPWRVVLLLLVMGRITAQPQDLSRPAEVSGTTPDTLSRRNAALVSFDRNLNTYNWVGKLVVDTAYGGTSLRILQNYVANIIQVDAGTAGRRRLVSTQENMGLTIDQKLNNQLGLQFQWSSLVYSDDKAVGLSNASGHSVLGGLDVTPVAFLTVTPLLGYRWDNQTEIRDRGLSYTLSARIHEVDLDGYRVLGSGQLHEDHLNPRSLANHFGRIGVQKWFSSQTRDSIEFGYSRLKREFYALADNNIESRVENILVFTNLLEYEVDRGLLTSFFATISSRGLDKDLRRNVPGLSPTPQFNTHIDEFRLDSYLQVQYRSADGRIAGLARMGYGERDEAHTAKSPADLTPATMILFNERNRQEQSKDNVARRTSLAGMLTLPLSFSDRLTVSGGAGILRYDTPSILNVEDRDELLVSASVGTSHHISSSLEIALTLDGILSHVVYLLKERSANNNINRVLRFAPRAIFRPTRFLTSANALEVLANYTVYDFEQQLALVRSFSYRQFGWIDSTGIRLTDRVGLHFYSYIKLYQRGQLKWSDFTERIENSFADQTFTLQLRFTPDEGTVFAIGMQYFSQSRYSYEQATKRLASFQRSVGPTCMMEHDLGQRGQLNLRGWYEHRKQPDGTERALASVTIAILLNF
jgi:hypothetical protein